MSATNVIKPDQFNGHFTIYLNVAGDPVQRTLGEMTADEVLLALEWHSTEADRLIKDAAPISAMMEKMARSGASPPELVAMTQREYIHAKALLHQALEAGEKCQRLMLLVNAKLPRNFKRLGDAVRWHWPSAHRL